MGKITLAVSVGAGLVHGFSDAVGVDLGTSLETMLTFGPTIWQSGRGMEIGRETFFRKTRYYEECPGQTMASISGGVVGVVKGAAQTALGYGIGYGTGYLLKTFNK